MGFAVELSALAGLDFGASDRSGFKVAVCLMHIQML